MGIKSYLNNALTKKSILTWNIIFMLGGLLFGYQNCAPVEFTRNLAGNPTLSNRVVGTPIIPDFNADFQWFENQSNTQISSVVMKTGTPINIKVQMLNNGALSWPDSTYELVALTNTQPANLFTIQKGSSTPTGLVPSTVSVGLPMVLTMIGSPPQACVTTTVQFQMRMTPPGGPAFNYGEISAPLTINIGLNCGCPVNSQFNSLTQTCDCIGAFGPFPDGSCQCPTNSNLTTCQCPTDSTLVGTVCQCPLNSTLNTSNNTCNCGSGFIMNSTTHICECDPNAINCNCGPNSTRDPGTGVCQCDLGFGNVGGVCVCNTDITCNCSANSSPVNGVCACDPTYVENNLNTVCICPAGAAVGNDQLCHCPGNSVVNGNACVCPAGFTDTNVDPLIVNCACSNTASCSCPANSAFDPNKINTAEPCGCNAGFTDRTPNDGVTVCSCNNSITCACPANSAFNSTNGACECITGFADSDPGTGLTCACSTPATCQCGPNTTVTGGQCACLPEFIDTDGSTTNNAVTCSCNSAATCSCPSNSHVTTPGLANPCACDTGYTDPNPNDGITECVCSTPTSCSCNDTNSIVDPLGVCACAPDYKDMNSGIGVTCVCNSTASCSCPANSQINPVTNTTGICECVAPGFKDPTPNNGSTSCSCATAFTCGCGPHSVYNSTGTNNGTGAENCACATGYGDINSSSTITNCQCNLPSTCNCGPNSIYTGTGVDIGPSKCACAAGFIHTPSQTSTSVLNCQCPAGFQNVDGVCLFECPAGQHRNSNNTSCTACEVGTFNTSITTNLTCTSCPPPPRPNAHYTTIGDSTGACLQPCLPGYQDVGGVCLIVCPPGQHRTEQNTCVDCEVGKYNPVDTTSLTCTACTNGGDNITHTSSGGTQNNCNWTCVAPFHHTNPPSDKCVPIGYWQPTCTYTPGDACTTDVTSCNGQTGVCTTNKYCNGTRTAACVVNGDPCSDGHTCWCDQATYPSPACTVGPAIPTGYTCGGNWRSCSPACDSSCTETCTNPVANAWGPPGSTPGNSTITRQNPGGACAPKECNTCGCVAGGSPATWCPVKGDGWVPDFIGTADSCDGVGSGDDNIPHDPNTACACNSGIWPTGETSGHGGECACHKWVNKPSECVK